jgi:hypothetical protein
VRAVLAIVALAIVLVFVGGVGWIAGAVAEAETVRIAFQYVLVAAVATTFAALGVAVIVGLWHLYLYVFTKKKPVSLFASVEREDQR